MLNLLSQPNVNCYLIAFLFIVSGTWHFIKPSVFVHIMPDYIPFHLPLVYISGGAEIIGAIGMLLPLTRVITAYCLLALLVAVFPANIDMTLKAVGSQGYTSWYSIITLARLPLQFVLMYWVYWAALKN